MTLIKDLIQIPEQIHKDDFVLKLAEGVTRAENTLREYVVTPELRKCFDDALGFIQSGLLTRTSKATYLHGSFGSGKSHFMAVLHLILQGNRTARGIPELAPVVSKHNEWIAGKKFLLVPYHMIGSADMESGILGGYVEFIRRVHPEAPIPGVYRAEGLFRDAENLRKQMGDDRFFGVLGGNAAVDSEFGDVDRSWDAGRFESAMIAPPGSEERSQLISVLITKFFGSYDMQAGAHGEAFLSLDQGLSVMSKHAAALGYDGLILFLDELVLWLASRAADLKFVHQEGQKLAKLVEAQTPDRPIPVISFVARQRDLSELIGDAVPGADRLNFGDALKHWEGRFHKITLEDRNLPAIAEKRVLKVKGDGARHELDAAFEQTRSIREAVMNVLLTREGDRAMFRKVYPFSPALVQTLIAVSSVLQRERTALKVMMQLLVDHRETLALGDLVPVGDLYDVVAHGDEAFSQDMAIHFENAQRLYLQKLLPAIEKQHGRKEDLDKLPYDDPRRTAFRNDDRLVKTLLLSALVPQVESLRSLTADRLAALNHGTIRTPIPGKEGQEVLRRCKSWAASVGEVKIGEEANPTISIQLSGVDTESIISQAAGEDRHGNRVQRVRQMLYEQAKIEREGEFEQSYELTWKNTRRSCVVIFRNIRELADSSLENDGGDWKLVIDFPFDEPGHGPRDDLSKIQAFRQSHPRGAKTICWVPAFFSDEAKKDLGLLVTLEHILTGERYAQYSGHLSPQDRQAAKSLLENQRSVLRQRVQSHLDAAYGLEPLLPGSLDTVHDLEPSERFVSLQDGFEPRPPVAANLAGAMSHLVCQALEHEFPGAPEFEAEVKSSHLKKVFEIVSPAATAADERAPVDKSLRALVRGIANPLKLGEMKLDATHFVIGQHWRNHFTRKLAEGGLTPATGVEVRQLREWINMPRPMGLPREAEILVILLYALQTNQSFFIHGAPFTEPNLSNLLDRCILKQDVLPPPPEWKAAVDRAGSILGLAISPLLNSSNVAALTSGAKKRAGELRAACQSYGQRLRDRLDKQRLLLEGTDRLETAIAASQLVEKLNATPESAIVAALAAARIATSESAMGECLAKASSLAATIDGTNWEIFEAITRFTDERAATANEILGVVEQVLRCDEHVQPLAATLKTAQSKAVRLLTPKTPTPTPLLEWVVVGRGGVQPETVAAAKAKLDELSEEPTGDDRRIVVTMSWRIEEKR